MDGDMVSHQIFSDVRELQANQDEDQTVEEEFKHLPKRATPQARLEAEDLGSAPTDVKTGGHDREHTGDAKAIRRQVSGKRREQGKR